MEIEHNTKPNTDALQELACPSCGHTSPLTIEQPTHMHDDGYSDIEDLEWDDDCNCACPNCDYKSTVSAFRIENQEKDGKARERFLKENKGILENPTEKGDILIAGCLIETSVSNSISFCEMPLSTLKKLLEPGYISRDTQDNEAPPAGIIIDFMEKWPQFTVEGETTDGTDPDDKRFNIHSLSFEGNVTIKMAAELFEKFYSTSASINLTTEALSVDWI